MPLAARLNDKGTRHDGYYETVITAGSSTVFIDGLPAACQGDPLTPH
ncbi:PAAR domain-containing protein, partial [Escherichia coli]